MRLVWLAVDFFVAEGSAVAVEDEAARTLGREDNRPSCDRSMVR